jgi:hypothetical protein
MTTKINFKLENILFEILGEDEVTNAYQGTYMSVDQIVEPRTDIKANIEDYNEFLGMLADVYGISKENKKKIQTITVNEWIRLIYQK